VPLISDQQGTVVREVAPARFALPLPDHPGQILSLSVVLIRPRIAQRASSLQKTLAVGNN
jgi:hypothetical protein